MSAEHRGQGARALGKTAVGQAEEHRFECGCRAATAARTSARRTPASWTGVCVGDCGCDASPSVATHPHVGAPGGRGGDQSPAPRVSSSGWAATTTTAGVGPRHAQLGQVREESRRLEHEPQRRPGRGSFPAIEGPNPLARDESAFVELRRFDIREDARAFSAATRQ